MTNYVSPFRNAEIGIYRVTARNTASEGWSGLAKYMLGKTVAVKDGLDNWRDMAQHWRGTRVNALQQDDGSFIVTEIEDE